MPIPAEQPIAPPEEERRRVVISCDATIDFVNVDVSMTEDHERTAELTDHPVETGANVTDHRRIGPRSFKMRGVVSDTPSEVSTQDRQHFERVAQAVMRRSRALGPEEVVAQPTTRAKDAYAVLETLFESHDLLTVLTDLREYKSVHMTSLTVHRDGQTGRALDFQASFREVLLANSERVLLVVDTPSGKPKKQKGKVASKKFEGPIDNRTDAAYKYDLAHGGGGSGLGVAPP